MRLTRILALVPSGAFAVILSGCGGGSGSGLGTQGMTPVAVSQGAQHQNTPGSTSQAAADRATTNVRSSTESAANESLACGADITKLGNDVTQKTKDVYVLQPLEVTFMSDVGTLKAAVNQLKSDIATKAGKSVIDADKQAITNDRGIVKGDKTNLAGPKSTVKADNATIKIDQTDIKEDCSKDAQPAPTTITFTAQPTALSYYQGGTWTVQLTRSGDNAPISGETIEFEDSSGDPIYCTAEPTDQNGYASCSATQELAVGTDQIVAIFAGDNSYQSNTGTSTQVIVNQAQTFSSAYGYDFVLDQYCTLGCYYSGYSFNIEAYVYSQFGGPVTGTISINGGGCSVAANFGSTSEGVANCYGAFQPYGGSVSVTASYSGDANNLPSSYSAYL